MREIEIAGRKVGDGHAPLICAEAGINHNGSIATALEMVSVAAQSGVDMVKFGVFKADEFCAKSDPLYETFKRCELPDDAWFEIKAECERHDVIFFATPQNESDLEILLKVGVPCIKIGSDDLTNTSLIHAYAQHRLPIILSTGMADADDIYSAVRDIWNTVKLLKDLPELLVCVCTSEYPCAPMNANLKRITHLMGLFQFTPIGFSDHTEGAQAATVAAALGACYFEKHFTLDNGLQGPDHAWAANPLSLLQWTDMIRHVDVLLGTGRIEPTEQELVNRVHWRRKSGQQIRGENV